MTSQLALITGGSRGIGKNMVDFFKKKNWTVATCSKSKDWFNESNADFSFTCDISKKEQVIDGINNVVEQFGKIDVLINNAGITGCNPIEPTSSDELWHDIIDTNLNGAYYMCKYALPHIKDKTGRIINISSVLGVMGVSDQSAYSVSKHAVIGLTKCFAIYAAPRSITVNAICPGWVETEMMQKRIESLSLTTDDIKKTIPLSKILQSEEISSFAHYLTTSQASSFTGQAIILDGGQLLNIP
jgi:NAD(P)-dependent dehydrogenase (short-subunit alcohol dehydrogenase family)